MKTLISLRNYSKAEEQKYAVLLQSSIAQLPFTLSSPIKNLTEKVEEGSYGKAMNYALDFFEISVQYLSCLLIAMIQKEEEMLSTKHESLIRAINKIDDKRPLSFGDWINDIYLPLLKAAECRIPTNPLIQSLSKKMVSEGYNLLLGGKKEPSIVQIRNEYKGHSTTLSEDIYKGVIYTLETRIFTMLEAITPLQDWTFFTCDKQVEDNLFDITVLNGRGFQTTMQATEILKPHHYYIQGAADENNKDTLLDLFPLVFSNAKKYIYVFQTLRNEDICYISSNENAIRHVDDCWNEEFDRYLQKTVPAFDISKELNWDEIRLMTRHTSRRFIEDAYKDKKYNKELFVNRAILSSFFNEFISSDKTLFPLIGEAGQGKTNQLCYWTEELIKQNKSVLIFNSSRFSEYTLEESLKKIFDYNPRRPIKKLLDNIHQHAENNQEVVYFLFDAINECLTYNEANSSTTGPLKLYQDIYHLLVDESYPYFKVLLTCRNYTWINLIQSHIPANNSLSFNTNDGEDIYIRGFTDEELEKAYGIYQELYQMGTLFNVLDRRILIRLKDPLVLKITCTNYLSAELPTSMNRYSSIHLFDKMLHDISNSYAGIQQCSIIKELARLILDKYEKGIAVDSISNSELQNAYDDKYSPLHKMALLIYKKDEISVAYGELLNKPERPILRMVEKDNGEKQLQFIYERFLEYMLALVFIERERSRNQILQPEIFVEALKQSNTNVVFMGAMRNALIMDFMHTKDFSILIQLVKQFGKNYEVMQLMTDVINILIQENYESEVFKFIYQLLDEQINDGEQLIAKFNAIEKKIESNQADNTVISQHNQLYGQLAPLIRLRKLASVSTVNGIFLSDYFIENIYNEDPYSLLWRLLTDTLNDVQNDTCLHLYYLSKKTHSLSYSKLDQNVTEQVVLELLTVIKGTPIAQIALQQKNRKKSIIFLETAVRLSTLLIIDALMEGKEGNHLVVKRLLNGIRSVLKHFTGNFYLLRIMMPFFRIILRRQITFQSTYVNNAIEYQTFWEDDILQQNSSNENEWSRESLQDLLVFIFHHSRYYKDKERLGSRNIPALSEHEEKILSAYKMGDSLSYFALERILVIMGVCSWDYIYPIILSFFADEYRKSKWFDYSQMSMLYVLFQLTVNTGSINKEIITLFSRECADWTRRCRGLFKAHNSHKANPSQLYKRNVMNWYCVVYCRHIGDAAILDGDEKSVPVFYKLLDEAIAQKDKELLYHLIENISELISDFGYIRTAIDLLKYILLLIDSTDKVNEINSIKLDRGGIYDDDIITLVGKVLSTAKNYFPTEVDSFLKKDAIELKFPGMDKYSAEILNFNPSGESLSDLFTHKFGNFLMWSLLNEEAVGEFAHDSMSLAANSSNFIDWFDQVIRVLFKSLFKIKL